ncbi:lysophospholipid acyltransferase family protein [Leptospira perdikensis]|uniref:1-acyl-sn-glycerol-3-phosphate acyltransferase n=1 Tax=Leptospira perdikensis TaxID=2484948 RepID=A0A4R9JGT4_9LEPT|nr:1-acyl-sn-glycerol-3-phosphate acyltransferase [Leptospira perdikensis]TGL38937.1 1-acyl-sn-glycerol-3-phosphate acyltransferase [Leptospira perdikensis]
MFYVLGRLIGFIFMWAFVKPMRQIYGRKKVTLENDHILREFSGKSVILIANHIKPRNKFLRLITLPYDAFVIRGVLKRYGIYTTALASIDSGKKPKDSFQKAKKQKMEQLIKGIVTSIDLIPVNRNESDPRTMKEMKQRIAKGSLGIGIFPEGTWFRGFRKSRKLHPGMAVLSKRYGLPIIPMFLDAYNLNKPIRLSVGYPIREVKDASETVSFVRSELIRMKDKGTSVILPQKPVEVLEDENDGLEISPSIS